MKLTRLIASGSLLFFTINVYADMLPLRDMVSQSDLIVEGTISQAYDDFLKKTPGHVGQTKDSVILKFAPKAFISVKIDKILEGVWPADRPLSVVSVLDNAEDLKNLTAGKKYILFLQKQKSTGMFFILNDGKAQWRIFDYNGQTKVKPWYQATELKDSSSYQDYDDFIREMKR